ncbi:MAG: tape measure protein [Chloroflexota bacterium]|nr:tape measure protein [Chloroflexota bacterium]
MADTRLDIIVAAQDRASKTIEGLTAKTGDLQKSVTGLSDANRRGETRVAGLTGSIFKANLAVQALGLGARAAGNAIQAAFDVGGNVLEAAASYQQVGIAFRTLLGDAGRARTLLKQVSDFARQTPFEIPQVAEAAKQLLAFGFAAEEVIPNFRVLGDITALIGTDKLPQLMLAFGQTRAATRLTGNELRQFTEAGVPLLDTLARQFNVSTSQMTEMISAGRIGFPAVQQALTSMTQEGGVFFQGMKQQSETFNGTISNLRDNFTRMSLEIIGVSQDGTIREGSIFHRLSGAAQDLLRWIDQNRVSIEQFGAQLADRLVNFINTQVVPTLQEFGRQLGAYLSSPRFQQDVRTVGASLMTIGSALKDMVVFGSQVIDIFNKINSIPVWNPGRSLPSGLRSLWNGVARREAGGPVMAGRPYIVGEREPELFVPRQSGTILNGSQMAGGNTYTFNHYGDIRSDVDIHSAFREMGFRVTR